MTVDVDGVEYVVPAADAKALGLTSRPLSVVGVTEHGSYWRDVRRVLFSGSQFTMLCRVARDGLWSSWEPVKLADVLKEVLPTFPDLIADVGRTGLSLPHTTAPSVLPPIAAALEGFIDRVEASAVPGLTPEGVAAARQVATGPAVHLPKTLTGQNEAFRLVIARLREHGCTCSGDEWVELVRDARESAGLVLFDQPQQSPALIDQAEGKGEAPERLLDTEVIAIYW